MNRRNFLTLALVAPLLPTALAAAKPDKQLQEFKTVIADLTTNFDRLNIEGKRKIITAFDDLPNKLEGEAPTEVREFIAEMKSFYQRRLDCAEVK